MSDGGDVKKTSLKFKRKFTFIRGKFTEELTSRVCGSHDMGLMYRGRLVDFKSRGCRPNIDRDRGRQ